MRSSASVGGDWYWLTRLDWTLDRWRKYLDRPGVETWVAWHRGTPAGYIELEGQADAAVEIAYFGLLPDFIGRGIGGYLLTFGMGFSAMAPVYASAVSDKFAGRNLGTILGVLDLGFGLGSALGPWWAGWMFDRYGSYDAVILGVALGVVLTGVGLATATRRGD